MDEFDVYLDFSLQAWSGSQSACLAVVWLSPKLDLTEIFGGAGGRVAGAHSAGT
jgi:hypothetical protein